MGKMYQSGIRLYGAKGSVEAITAALNCHSKESAFVVLRQVSIGGKYTEEYKLHIFKQLFKYPCAKHNNAA